MPKFEIVDNRKYEVEIIRDSTIYIKETNRHPPKLYYLITQKGYKNIISGIHP